MNIYDTEVWGFKKSIKGMRNPKNSWHKSDSGYNSNGYFIIGENDLKLAHTLILGGGEHSKFMRMIHVQVEVDMPRYFWSEMDTYKFNTKNSCSTMHKLLNNPNPITEDLFVICEEDSDIVELVIDRLESLRIKFKDSTNGIEKNRLLVRAKRLLMDGFLQLRTFDTNYAELRNIYFQRRNHQLKEEWQDTFCKWIETLPYAKELIMYEK